MQQDSFIIGNREFTAVRMNAFSANTILLRIQKIAVPIIGAITASGKNIGDVDVREAASAISAHIDESIMENVVLPMFAESKVYCVESKRFIKSHVDIDQCFTAENLIDFYELIFVVARFQFGPFLESLMNRFGSQVAVDQSA